MEAFAAESRHVKEHVVSVFDGQSMDFRVWIGQLDFYLMANGLYSGILDEEDPGEKKTLAQRQLACYGIININLSDSCRDMLRRLKTTDPKKCWEALIAEYDNQHPTSQMMLLDSLIELKCSGPVLVYISEFNLTVAKLQSMSIAIDERLLIALLLRGLPINFQIFCSTIRHREKVPSLGELCTMIKMEDKTFIRTNGSTAYSAVQRQVSTTRECSGCRRIGHAEEQCWPWVLHPEIAPRCRKCNAVGHLAKFCT